MLSFRMKPEWLGDPEIPFESRLCPNCEALNWAAGRHICGIGISETEAIRCWNCKTIFWLDGHSLGCVDDPSEAIICHGEPDPAIPIQVLRDLIDAAQQNWGEMMAAHERKPELDNDLVKIRDSLMDSINYVANLIHDLEVA